MNSFHGIRMGRSKCLIHLFFVDDILIFCSCADSDGNLLKEILALFCEAMGMLINVKKSAIYLSDAQGPHRQLFPSLFNFPIHEMGDGLKYLGFNLKPNKYGSAD